ncbi:MAG: hypothetical protein AAGH72_13120 [Verrucomicrobiota bacterium]
MNKRPDKTFLIQAGEHFLRVDLQRRQAGYQVLKTLRGRQQAIRKEADTEDFFVEAKRHIDIEGITGLLKQGGKPAREISVLSDQITAVVAEVDAIGESDWHSAAQMEAQTVSGLSTAESMFASSRLSSEQGLVKAWTVQVSMRNITALRAAIGQVARGSRLITVGHPAGIRMQSPSAQLENWSDFALYHVPDVPNIDLKGWNGASAIADALADPEVAAGLMPSEQPAYVIVASDQQFENSNSLNWLDFAQDPAIEAWASALAEACDPLTGRILGMPLVAVPKAPLGNAALAMASVGFAAVMILILGIHYGLTLLNEKHLRDDLAEFEAPAEKIKADREKISALKVELKKLDAELESSYQSDEIDVLAHRKRISALLAGVSEGSNIKEAVVLEISPDEDMNTLLSGIATSFNAAQDLARNIDTYLAEHGWRATLFRRTAKLLRDDGGPWTYEIRLSPSPPRKETREVVAETPAARDDRSVPNQVSQAIPNS